MRYQRGSEKLVEWVPVYRKVQNEEFTWSQIKGLDFQDDDRVRIEFEEGNDYDDSYYSRIIFEVTREEIESDEDYTERQIWCAKQREEDKKDRYQRYLKLKAEFEPNE